MDNSISMLSRQSGLLEATEMLANNIANASTPGYKGEGTIFAEHIAVTGADNPSLSMGHLIAHSTDFTGGPMRQTGATFDLAIQGEGFFKITTPGGDRLTRAGAFHLDAEGALVDSLGHRVADDGGAPIEIPPDAVSVIIAQDGSVSVDGELFANIGVYEPAGEMQRVGNNYWVSPEGSRVMEEPTVLQGVLEGSNVSPVQEFAKLIHTQRLFEAGQTLIDQENDRLESLIDAIRNQG